MRRQRSWDSWQRDFTRATNGLIPVLRAWQSGKWKPKPADLILLRALPGILRELSK